MRQFAAVALLLGGALMAPGFSFAMIPTAATQGAVHWAQIAAKAIRQDNTSSDPIQLPDKAKFEPKPHPPMTTACERWKGRAFISRHKSGSTQGCLAQCVAKLVSVEGSTARWEITGAQCTL